MVGVGLGVSVGVGVEVAVGVAVEVGVFVGIGVEEGVGVGLANNPATPLHPANGRESRTKTVTTRYKRLVFFMTDFLLRVV
jgi:hypothetical protein